MQKKEKVRQQLKKLISLCLVAAAILSSAAFAFAMEVPVSETVQNLNGVQQCIKVYTVPADTAPETLAGEDFTYEGYTYSFSSMTKNENWFENEKDQTTTITVETEKNDLGSVLAELPVTVDFDENGYAGVLYLDHSTIETKAAGYKTGSYTVRESREFSNLDSNDMSYIPMTVTKDGKTLKLCGLNWEVQATSLIDDVLVPSMFKAVASYEGSAGYSKATGYITTAEYIGKVSCRDLDNITYTVTYTGKPVPSANLFSSAAGKVAIGIAIAGIIAAILVMSLVKTAGKSERAFEKFDAQVQPEEKTDGLEKEDEECEQKYY